MKLERKFGETVFMRRRELGLSLQAAAEKAGIKYSTISGVEDGKCIPKLDTALKLARALDFDLMKIAPGKWQRPRGLVTSGYKRKSPPLCRALVKFGEELKRRRVELNIDINETCERAKINRSALSKYENGHAFPRAEIYPRLMLALKFNVDDFDEPELRAECIAARIRNRIGYDNAPKNIAAYYARKERAKKNRVYMGKSEDPRNRPNPLAYAPRELPKGLRD